MRDCFMLGAHHGLVLEDIDYVCDVLKRYKPDMMVEESKMDPGNCDL